MDEGCLPAEITVLPNLLYLGDVPIEASYHGSALMYRLLQRYPADRLMIVEGNLIPPRTDRRLPHVSHATLTVGRPRLLNSRFHGWYSRWLLAGARQRAALVPGLLAGFTPDAVLTVAHGYSWVTAAQYARTHRLPLHVVVHDDWPRVVAEPMRARVDREFAAVYRQAASRLCVSPYMAEELERRYGVRGTRFLPSRAPDGATFADVPERLLRATAAPVFAFAGTINSPGYATLLRHLALGIAKHKGELLIFGPITPAQAAAEGLAGSNIRLGGLLSSSDLLPRLRQEADVLYVPMSFAAPDRDNMQMGFPSKLTDYTAAGLPLLICGPAYCSAVRWATENPGVAEVVTAETVQALDAAVARLLDRDHRLTLARRAREVGERDFSPAAAEAAFHAALRSAVAA